MQLVAEEPLAEAQEVIRSFLGGVTKVAQGKQ
jgi:hypothetical protein